MPTVEPTRIHIAHFLDLERSVTRLLDDVSMLKDVSINHGDLIRELLELTANAASKAELMAAITTTRYQQLNLRIAPKRGDDEDEIFDSKGLKSLRKFFTI